MKKVILLLMICLSAKMTFAQSNSAPPIIYKADTIQYPVTKYKIDPKSNVAQLLKIMEGFEMTNDSLITHQGQAIDKIKLNGKYYAGLSIARVVKKIMANMVESVEVIDDYGDAAAKVGGGKSADPKKVLNLNLKKQKPYEVLQLFGLDVLPVIPNRETHAITKIRLDGGRDYASDDIAEAIINGPTAEPTIDDYGDQIPHFVFKELSLTWNYKTSNYTAWKQ